MIRFNVFTNWLTPSLINEKNNSYQNKQFAVKQKASQLSLGIFVGEFFRNLRGY